MDDYSVWIPGNMTILRDVVTSFSNYFAKAWYVIILIWLCAFQSVILIIYQLYKSRMPNVGLSVIIDAALIGLGARLYQIYLQNSIVMKYPSYQLLLDGTKMSRFCLNMAADSSYHNFRFDVYISIEAALIWVKFILMFENTKTFGPTIKIIQVMVLNMIKFLFVWVLVIITFGCVGLLIFRHNVSFSLVTSTFYFLICAALGNWDSSVFDRSNWDIFIQPYLTNNDIYSGKVFLLLFQVFNSVILLNFVIAVLSATYSQLSPLSIGLYYDTLINTIQTKKYDKYYGALTCSYQIMSPLVLIIAPFFCFFKPNSSQLE